MHPPAQPTGSSATTTARPGADRPTDAASGPGPRTLAIDIGGTGLKASVLDAQGAMVADRVRVPTTYPCPPSALVDALAALVAPLPPYDRVSAGFPGMVRDGLVLSAPHFVTEDGPGTAVDDHLVEQWARFPLADALEQRLGKPARVANDADVQGAAVVAGRGLELVITLGTGFGTAMFHDGRLLPHLEFAHFRFRAKQTFNEQVGDAARRKVGDHKWNRRVAKAVDRLRQLMFFDHCYIGGGNAARLTVDLGDDVEVVDNAAGILGGIKLWEGEHLGV